MHTALSIFFNILLSNKVMEDELLEIFISCKNLNTVNRGHFLKKKSLLVYHGLDIYLQMMDTSFI